MNDIRQLAPRSVHAYSFPSNHSLTTLVRLLNSFVSIQAQRPLMTQQRSRRWWALLLVGGFVWMLSPSPLPAQDSTDHYHHSFDNPEQYADDWNDPTRDDWQQPTRLIEAMGVKDGMTVADLGAGTGYFIPYLSRAVGEDGQVLAVDIEPAMLDYIVERTRKHELGNVDTVLARPEHTRLDEASVDRILTVNTWHHIPNRGTYAQHLARRLKDGGSVWVVDFEREAPMGPPRRHRLTPESIMQDLEAGGFEAQVQDLGLPHQFVIVGQLD